MSAVRRGLKMAQMYAEGATMSVIAYPILAPPLIALFLFILALNCWKISRKLHASREKRLLEQFAGPPAYPILGNVGDMLFTDFYEWSERICKRWGDPLRLWKFGHPIVFVSSYKYAAQLLSNNNFNGKLHDLDMIYRNPGGRGLSTTPASFHAEKRKLLLPAFSRQIVEGSIPVFCEESRRLVKRLERYADNGEIFDVVNRTMICLFRMVARSDFGDTFLNAANDSEDNTAIQHMNALHTVAKNMTSRILGPYLWQRSDFIYFHISLEGIETRKARDVINKFALQAIRKRQAHLAVQMSRKEPISVQEDTNSEMLTSPQKCYLDILLGLMDKGHLKEDDVVSELNNFLGGAYDTTALTVCWTLLLLALHPAHQRRCYDELSELLSERFKASLFSGSENDDLSPMITAADTKKMKYLELCLKESLRLYPPAPIFPRSTVDDMELDDGRIIPGGVDVLIFANLIHRDPQHFPEPEKFQPERHLEGSSPAFMPFSLGVRNCIGQVYGMYQAKIVLAYLLMAYEWEVSPQVKRVEDVRIAYQGLLYPAEGINLKIKRRR